MTVITLTEDFSVEELVEYLDEREQYRSEMAAEIGMGAVSLGYDGNEAMNLWLANHGDDDFAREARARIAEAYPPREPDPYLVPDDGDDLPF